MGFGNVPVAKLSGFVLVQTQMHAQGLGLHVHHAFGESQVP